MQLSTKQALPPTTISMAIMACQPLEWKLSLRTISVILIPPCNITVVYSTELLSGIVGKALVNGHGCHGIEGTVRCIASQVLIIRLSADHGSIVAAQRKRRQTQPQTPLFTFRCEHGPELTVGRDTAGYNDSLASGMLLGQEQLFTEDGCHGMSEAGSQILPADFLPPLGSVMMT